MQPGFLRSLASPANLRRLVPSCLPHTFSSPTYRLAAAPARGLRSSFSSPSIIPTTRTMATATAGADALLEAIKSRRSYYALTKELPVSTDRIQAIVKKALAEVPSSFNSQSNRVIVLFGAEHDKFWDITTAVLKAIVPADSWESTASRMASFKAGAGTILFYEDSTPVKAMQEKFAIYAERFPGWASQSIGMLQFALWTALEADGLGANLQHYNPIVDDKVAEAWNVPATWKLNAQLVFGGRGADAQPKDYAPLETIYKVYGA